MNSIENPFQRELCFAKLINACAVHTTHGTQICTGTLHRTHKYAQEHYTGHTNIPGTPYMNTTQDTQIYQEHQTGTLHRTQKYTQRTMQLLLLLPTPFLDRLTEVNAFSKCKLMVY